MKTLLSLSILSTALALTGCSTGELRAFEDSMAAANGEQISYQNSRTCKMLAQKLDTCYGLYSNNGYWHIRNTSGDHCHGHLILEDGSQQYHYIEPRGTRKYSYSVYNQPQEFSYQCAQNKAALNRATL